MTTKRIFLTLGLLAVIFGGYLLWRNYRLTRPRYQPFDAARAYQDVLYQTSLGARTPGSEAHEKTIDYLRRELQTANWLVEVQAVEVNGHMLKNVIARRSDVPPQIILAAHYDSRLMADKDPSLNQQQEPVPGANDGASGTALLLELGRVIPSNSVPLWLVFFDGEDQGNIPGWEEWALGARAFVETFTLKPRAVIVLDMVGDFDLNIYQEKQSDPRLVREIWEVAYALGYGQYFLAEKKYSIMDDHVPFLDAGIPAVDIIDIEYRYWHTTYDTADKVSPESLEIVGKTIQVWLAQQDR